MVGLIHWFGKESKWKMKMRQYDIYSAHNWQNKPNTHTHTHPCWCKIPPTFSQKPRNESNLFSFLSLQHSWSTAAALRGHSLSARLSFSPEVNPRGGSIVPVRVSVWARPPPLPGDQTPPDTQHYIKHLM